jgi:peptidoglycan/LPS O-acetylase OafA/YrhL
LLPARFGFSTESPTRGDEVQADLITAASQASHRFNARGTATPNGLEGEPGKLGYVPALDGIRGVAILLVLGYHAYGHPSGGFFGVDIFFVLSGFLITTLLLEELADTGRVSFSRFYIRRARRLLPALIPFLFVVVLFHRAEPGKAAADLTAGLFYATNIVRAAGTSQTLPTIGHLWSLAEEEQFYLLWPAMLVVVMRWRPHRLAFFLAVSAALVAVYRVALIAGGATHERIYFAPDSHADPIIIGCLIAVIRSRGLLIRSKVWLAALPVLIVFVATMEHYTTASLLIGTTAVALGAGALIVAALDVCSLTARVLAFRPLVWVGTISYSLYIWQQLVYKFTPSPTLSVFLSTLVAWLSYRFVEQRFRRRRAVGESSSAPQPSAAPAS